MFGKKQEEKQITDTVDEEARQVMMIRYLDSSAISAMVPYVLYSFVLTYRDGHCRILEAKADDPLLTALLPKLM